MSTTLTKIEAVRNIVAGTSVSRPDTEIVIESFLKEIAFSLAKGERVEFRGFGSFEARMSKPRVGRNPRNPEAGPIQIPAKPVVKFKPGKELVASLGSKPAVVVVAQPVA
jgi:nucleoid DNA-binding protein